tara:strand:- start:30826 stop:31347 length:522 start_codon:yes stop_codon:yes gene_type:complete
MARNRFKHKGRADTGGGFGALPRVVWQSPDYCALPGRAVKLLMDLACQFNGKNNGDLTVAYSVLRKRGWSSKGTISAAVHDLLQAELIVQTRAAKGINPGAQAALYALAWHPIDECPGKRLSTGPTTTPPRKFSLERSKSPGPYCGPGPVQNVDQQRPRGDDGRFLPVQKQGR